MTSHPIVLARRSLFGLAALAAAGALCLPASMALAYSETSTKAVNIDTAGLAIRGYDPVAYFTVGKPTPGNAQFTAQHDGATYRFASAANRDAFVKEPAKYAPAFGGFCAMGAVFEKKLDGDPNLWRIVDGKLYLNVGEPAQKRWLEDVPGNIGKAQTNWTKIKDKAPKDL
ncbi:MAG: YHS domain-containing (seleno)protein [Afipia sp.]|nr:YHS domain-containing (seleno)protein [Afipia sp.]